MIDFVSAHGEQLAAGLSSFLVIALVAVHLQPSPVRRHRWSEGALLSVPVCAVLLTLPLDRAWRLAPSEELAPRNHLLSQAADSSVGTSGDATVSSTKVPYEVDHPFVATVFATVFTTGAGLMLLYLAGGALLVLRLLRGAEDLPSTLALPGERVVVAPRARRPFCVGTPRVGLIVLPETVATEGNHDQLEAVVAHERTHLREGHGRARLVAAALAPLLYWNPMYWLLVAQMRRDAELCADDAAAMQVGKARYVRALLSLVENQAPRYRNAPSLPLLGALAPTRLFLQRMESLMLRPKPLDSSVSRLWRGTSVALTLGAVALVNVACGTTGAGIRPVDSLSVSFEALSLDGTDLGAALAQGNGTEAPFPARVQALSGKNVTIEGYIVPLAFDGDEVSEFMLLRDFAECCTGGAPPMDHWLHAKVGGTDPLPYVVGERVKVEGNLETVHPSQWEKDGHSWSLYELRNWHVEPLLEDR